MTVIDATVTQHTDLIADHPLIEVSQLTSPEIIVDHIHIHPTYPQDEICIGHTHISAGKPHLRKNPRVKIEDPHMDYYSSDDHSSYSGEKADHLN